MSARDAYDASIQPDQTTTVEWITPAQASRWLQNANKGNRKLSPVVAARWRVIFDARRYRLTHQGWAFDREGMLIDGQHRAAGLASSSAAGVWGAVTRNADRESFAVLDTPLSRKAGQLIPGPYAFEKAAAIRYLVDSYPNIDQSSRFIEPGRIVDLYYDSLSKSVDRAVELAAPAYLKGKVPHSIHTALITLLIEVEHDPQRIEDWLTGLTTGAGLVEGDPRLTLRNRCMGDGSRLTSTGAGRWDGAYLIIRAWNAYLAGDRLSKIPLPKERGKLPEVAL